MKKKYNILTLVITLPVVLGILISIVGFAGIYISKLASQNLIELDETALRPALEFQEVSLTVESLSKKLQEIKLKELDERRKIKIVKDVKKMTKKLSRLLEKQEKEAINKPYGEYFLKQMKIWRDLKKDLESNYSNSSQFEGVAFELKARTEDLSKKLLNINNYIKSDSSILLTNSNKFSKKAVLILIGILTLGLFIGVIVAFFTIRSVKSLLFKIEKNQKDMETLLNNLEEGFMIFDQSGTIASGCTKAARKFFKCDPTNRQFGDVLQLSEKNKSSLSDWYELVFNGTLPFQHLAGLAPQSFEKNENQFIKLEYRPIFSEKDSGRVEQIICIAADKTTEKELKEKAKAEKEYAQLVIQLIEDKTSFRELVLEVRSCLKLILKELDKKLAEVSVDMLFRLTHTIKGGCSSYHVYEVSTLAHSFESELSSLRTQKNPIMESNISILKEMALNLDASFENFIMQNEKIIGKIEDTQVVKRSIGMDIIVKVLGSIEESLGSHSLVYKEYLESFILEPISSKFKKFEKIIKKVTKSEGKDIEYKINISDVKIYAEPYRPLLSSIIHLFRNAVAHGIEDSEDRVCSGKSETGVIEVDFKKIESMGDMSKLQIIIRDDGRGIDPLTIGEKALSKEILLKSELEQMTSEEVIQLVFHPGFSTSDRQVTDLSGRGVGLDAVMYEAKALGGTSWVESKLGKGSSFVVEIPLIQKPNIEKIKLSEAGFL